MKFTLYDIILNVYRVDEIVDAEAKVENKFILISTPKDTHRNYKDDKFLFDFWRDDIYIKHSTARVNTRIRIFNNDDTNNYNDYYARISLFNYLRLAWRFKKLWIQQKENLMWATNLLVLIISIVISTYISIILGRGDKLPTKVEIVSPTKLDEEQLLEILNARKSTIPKTASSDSFQSNNIVYH